MTTATLASSPRTITRKIPLRLRLARWIVSLLIRVLFRVRIIGKENIPEGSYIALANHLGWIDPLLLWIALPAQPRLYFIGAQQAFTQGWKIRLMQAFDSMIPVERGANWVGRDVFAKPLEVLEQGGSLGFFPEGNSFAEEGKLQPLQRGIGHFVLRADYPVVPVGLSGTRELYWHKPIMVTIGKAFHATKETAQVKNRHQRISEAVEHVASAIQAVIPPYQEPVVAHKYLHFLTDWLD